MPTERRSTDLGIGGQNPNIIQGSIYETMSRPTRVVVACVSNVGDTGLGVQFGSRTMCLPSQTVVPLEPGAGRGPIIADDVIVDDIALPGEKVVISLQGGIAVSTTRTLVNFTELA